MTPPPSDSGVQAELGRCCYGGFKTKRDCASCAAWKPAVAAIPVAAMSRDQIHQCAWQAGLPMSWLDDGKASAWPELERFAALLGEVQPALEDRKVMEQAIEALDDFAKQGLRHDLNPTVMFPADPKERQAATDMYMWWAGYIRSAEDSVRTRASRAIAALRTRLAASKE